MSVPNKLRSKIKNQLWKIADSIGWMNLSVPEKAKIYEDWTRNSSIGGLLAQYMEQGKIRVYIKDSL